MAERIAVFGAGRSGRAASELARSEGALVTVFDEAGQGDSTEFNEDAVDNFDRFVFSPGFAAQHPWRRLAERSDKPCLGEIGYAITHWKGRVFAITGTNGKSTLTGLLTEALNAAGQPAVAAGNIGHPLSGAVLSEMNRPDVIAVVEISSFQAELPLGIALDGLVWTNFAEDHLDRYASMGEYFAAKAQLFDTLKSDAICVVGPQVAHWMDLFHKDFTACTVACEDRALISQLSPHSPFKRFPYSLNFCLAAELWWLMDLPVKHLIATANDFQLAAHRLDVTAEFDGVRFWNDSKSTNFHATLAALTALEAAGDHVYWIGGGQVKGGDVEAFAKVVAGQIEGAYVYGEVGERLSIALGECVEKVEFHPSFEDAVQAASKAAFAAQPCNVLLSPGFSSFDQFSSYKERGKSFISIVLGLKEGRPAG